MAKFTKDIFIIQMVRLALRRHYLKKYYEET